MDATRIKQAALWTVVMLTMAFADIVGFLHAGTLQSILDGAVGFDLTPGVLLVFSILIEVPIAMVFLSLVLPFAANRGLSTAAALATTAFVLGGGGATSSYVFFTTVEIAVLALVVRLAWRRPSVRVAPDEALRTPG